MLTDLKDILGDYEPTAMTSYQVIGRKVYRKSGKQVVKLYYKYTQFLEKGKKVGTFGPINH